MKIVWKYIKSDYYRYYGKISSWYKILFIALFSTNHCFRYLFWYRLTQLNGIICKIARVMHYHYSIKYGIQIPRSTKIGYGFYIGHGVGIVINQGTVIGNNVNISQFLSIGSNKKTPAIIGDNVYIGPNVCIVEDVKIGNGVIIGAGSVVTRDITTDCIAVGIPAKSIGRNNHPEYVHNRWIL